MNAPNTVSDIVTRVIGKRRPWTPPATDAPYPVQPDEFKRLGTDRAGFDWWKHVPSNSDCRERKRTYGEKDFPPGGLVLVELDPAGKRRYRSFEAFAPGTWDEQQAKDAKAAAKAAKDAATTTPHPLVSALALCTTFTRSAVSTPNGAGVPRYIRGCADIDAALRGEVVQRWTTDGEDYTITGPAGRVHDALAAKPLMLPYHKTGTPPVCRTGPCGRDATDIALGGIVWCGDPYCGTDAKEVTR